MIYDNDNERPSQCVHRPPKRPSPHLDSSHHPKRSPRQVKTDDEAGDTFCLKPRYVLLSFSFFALLTNDLWLEYMYKNHDTDGERATTNPQDTHNDHPNSHQHRVNASNSSEHTALFFLIIMGNGGSIPDRRDLVRNKSKVCGILRRYVYLLNELYI
jgi:hypothetical protein